MRYQKGHREETHRQILETAAARFRRDGIHAVGIKSIMADVGLTHGGFYAHFPKREDLVARAVEEALADTLGTLREQVEQAAPARRLEAFVDSYLSDWHCAQIERGCAGAALAGEVAREPRDARDRFERGIARIVALLEDLLPPGGKPRQREDRAYAVFAGLMGSLQLARAAADPKLGSRLRKSARATALAMAAAPWD